MEIGRSIRFNRSSLLIIGILGVIFVLYLLTASKTSNGYVEKTVKISHLLSASIFLAEQAGKAVVDIRKGGDKGVNAVIKSATDSSSEEYVTKGDHQSHAIITDGLRWLWPSLKYKSEEAELLKPFDLPVPRPPIHNSEVSRFLKRDEAVAIDDIVVWVDPLDATQEYTEGGAQPDLLKYVTVMMCIVINGQPIASVIHQPFVQSDPNKQGTTYWSWINHGVSPNIYKGSDISTSDTIRLISSRSHSGSVKKIADTAFKDKLQHITAAGAGYKSLQIARNKADLYFHTTKIKKWDTCAGDALISAMGGVMTTRTGSYITYHIEDSPLIEDGLVAARTETRHRLYLEKLKVK